ncbi:MAG: hypothetical protein PWR20_2258 [Bacteroidales bacterium]|jgi:hypothetical protein|nr:hypothetical protein [Bacteroidales bacterium]MDN5329719.1 hypothetical protein [Bacteroidales bacterium]
MRSEIFREIEESRRRFLDEAAAALNANLTYFIPLEGNTLYNEKMEEPFYEESPGTDEKKIFPSENPDKTSSSRRLKLLQYFSNLIRAYF